MIRCPECGQEISDRAKRCVHCGAAIFVCPECGKVSVGEGRCPECGYSVVPEAISAASTKEKQAEAHPRKNVYERWKAIDQRAQKRGKILSTIGIGLWVLEFVLMAIWFFQVLQPYLHINLQSILILAANHGAKLRQTNTYFAIIIVLEVLTFAVDSFKGIINYTACAKWIRRNKVDIGDDISYFLAQKKKEDEKKEAKDDEDEEENKAKEEVDVDDLGSAVFLAVDPNKTAFFAAIKIIPQLFIFAFSVFLSVCLKNNAVSFMNSITKGNFVDNGNGALVFSYKFSFDWVPLVVGAVIAIALIVALMIVFDRIRDKKIEKTLQKIQEASSK